LVIGGTGPSGPHIVTGLVERGFDVKMYHSGRHESDEVPDVEHIHGSAYRPQEVADALSGVKPDVVIATYGRVRHIAAEAAGKCEQFISVGGTPVYAGFVPPDVMEPSGLPARVTEEAPLVPPEGFEGAVYGAGAVRRTEDAVFALHENGGFNATVFRYPSIYGPRNPHSWEWTTIRRVLDGREAMVIPDGALPVHYRLSSWNAAQAILAAVDHPEEAAGQAFNCADDDQFSLRQWIEMIVSHMGGEIELLNAPGDVAGPGAALMVFRYQCSPHVVVDTLKIRTMLEYEDAVPAREGLARTVDWLIANREHEPSWSVLDEFDYETGDRYIATLREARRALAEAAAPYAGLPGMPLPQTASGGKKPTQA
jgi:nucleoside-diphosphate-sugar epimerase